MNAGSRPLSPVRLVCCGCQRVLREGAPGAAVSHGLCPECAQRLYPGVYDAAKTAAEAARG